MSRERLPDRRRGFTCEFQHDGNRRDPEWFHEEKSEVAHVLMQIAKRS